MFKRVEPLSVGAECDERVEMTILEKAPSSCAHVIAFCQVLLEGRRA